ncbi:MAG: hypothetical protein Q8S33_08620 [Myxococcales bacterium]|nr:hypothetical protein [Myxococcales bacterium]
MRARLVAALVAVFSLVALVRAGHAEPPPPMESRRVDEVLAALKASKADKATVSAVRWYVEVAHGTTLPVPVGSSKTTLGAWGDNGALMASESALNGCAPMEPAEAKAAAALLKEYGDALAPTLRGAALAQQGKADDAAALYRSMVLTTLSLDGPCPSEHPMSSGRRIGRLQLLLACVKRWQPKGDHARLDAVLQQAQTCAANNHSVG